MLKCADRPAQGSIVLKCADRPAQGSIVLKCADRPAQSSIVLKCAESRQSSFYYSFLCFERKTCIEKQRMNFV